MNRVSRTADMPDLILRRCAVEIVTAAPCTVGGRDERRIIEGSMVLVLRPRGSAEIDSEARGRFLRSGARSSAPDLLKEYLQ